MSRRVLALFVTLVAVLFMAPVDGRDDQELRRLVRNLVKQVKPSVVGVRFYYEESQAESESTTTLVKKVIVGSYSGIVRDNHGLIATMVPGGQPVLKGKHVQLEVVLHTGKAVPAEWVAADPETAISLVRVTDEDVTLSPVSDKLPSGLDRGSLVVAVGHSVTEPPRFSMGLVRDLFAPVRNKEFSFPRTVRASVAVEEGDIGGMLADARGVLVGMLAYEIPASDGDGQGPSKIAFAIPYDLLDKICDELNSHGEVTRGSLGAYIEFLDRSDMQKLGLGGVGGFIRKLDPKGPAYKVGLREGDIITNVANNHLRNQRQLHRFREIVEFGDIGDLLRLEVYRGTQHFREWKVFSVRIAKRAPFIENIAQKEAKKDAGASKGRDSEGGKDKSEEPPVKDASDGKREEATKKPRAKKKPSDKPKLPKLGLGD